MFKNLFLILPLCYSLHSLSSTDEGEPSLLIGRQRHAPKKSGATEDVLKEFGLDPTLEQGTAPLQIIESQSNDPLKKFEYLLRESLWAGRYQRHPENVYFTYQADGEFVKELEHPAGSYTITFVLPDSFGPISLDLNSKKWRDHASAYWTSITQNCPQIEKKWGMISRL